MENGAMQDHHLIRMGNQIATFFESFPDQQEALRELALHLKRFWPPQMRRALLSLLDTGQGEQAHRLLVPAVQMHRDLLE